jgi:hypothetical protein
VITSSVSSTHSSGILLSSKAEWKRLSLAFRFFHAADGF